MTLLEICPMEIPEIAIPEFFKVNPTAELLLKDTTREHVLYTDQHGSVTVGWRGDDNKLRSMNGGYQGRLTQNGSFAFGTGDRYTLVDDSWTKIKEFWLDQVVQYELRKLTPAIRQLLRHRHAENQLAVEDYQHAAIKLHVYRLVNPDFSQQFKGHVLVSIKWSGGKCENGDVLKGYTYVAEKDAILYEGVQAWRYELLTDYDLMQMGYCLYRDTHDVDVDFCFNEKES